MVIGFIQQPGTSLSLEIIKEVGYRGLLQYIFSNNERIGNQVFPLKTKLDAVRAINGIWTEIQNRKIPVFPFVHRPAEDCFSGKYHLSVFRTDELKCFRRSIVIRNQYSPLGQVILVSHMVRNDLWNL